MFSFSSLEIELFYLIAKADYTKEKIARAKTKKERAELEQKLKFNEDLIKQLKTKAEAVIN